MIQVAILGAGIGAQHLDGYRALPERFKVKTLCDLDAARAREVIGDDDIATSTDIADVLADPTIDLVDICLPPHLHAQVAEAAMQAGKHVVCEKPMARSLAEADRMIAVAKETRCHLFPVFQYRYGPAMAQLRALMHAGLAGKPYAASLETHWNRGSEHYAVPWRGTWAGELGGAILIHAIHNHDLLCHVMGDVASVSASLATRVHTIETEDCAAMALTMQSGAVATSSVTLGAATDATRLRFVFEGLTAESGTDPYNPAGDIWIFTARDPAMQGAIDDIVSGIGPVLAGFAGFLEAVADALSARPGREVTMADGRRSIELVSAVYEAARTGQRIDLPLGQNAASYTGWLPYLRDAHQDEFKKASPNKEASSGRRTR